MYSRDTMEQMVVFIFNIEEGQVLSSLNREH